MPSLPASATGRSGRIGLPSNVARHDHLASPIRWRLSHNFPTGFVKPDFGHIPLTF
jgi:hypothetical protein